MHSERGETRLHGWSDKQILDKVSATWQYLYFEKILQAFQKLEFFNFFVGWSITDANLFV